MSVKRDDESSSGSSPHKPELRWWKDKIHSPCSSGGKGSTKRMSAQRPSDAARAESLWPLDHARQSSSPSDKTALPTPTAFPGNCRRPKPSATEETIRGSSAAGAWLHPDPAYQPRLPGQSSLNRAYPPTDDAYAPSPACHCHSLSRPFFSGFHRLAIEDGGAGGRFSPLCLTQLARQHPIHPLPHSGFAPGIEVIVDRPFRREIVGQSIPLAPCP